MCVYVCVCVDSVTRLGTQLRGAGTNCEVMSSLDLGGQVPPAGLCATAGPFHFLWSFSSGACYLAG